ncbi:MAG: hypothetical protein ACJ8DF_04900 [Microvirga sp.]
MMETLCRVVAAQHRHADAAGVRVEVAVPDDRRMTLEAPAPLSRALPALLRAVIGAVRPGATVEMRVEGLTREVVQFSIAGPLGPGVAFAPPPGGGRGGFGLPAPARRAAAMVRNHGGRVEDRSSAAVGRLRLLVRLSFNPEDAVPVAGAKDQPDPG